jgi:hypothetical protein
MQQQVNALNGENDILRRRVVCICMMMMMMVYLINYNMIKAISIPIQTSQNGISTK